MSEMDFTSRPLRYALTAAMVTGGAGTLIGLILGLTVNLMTAPAVGMDIGVPTLTLGASLGYLCGLALDVMGDDGLEPPTSSV